MNEPDDYYNDIASLLEAGDIENAAKQTAALVGQYVDYAPGWFLLSKVSELTGKGGLAAKAALKAVSLQSENIKFLLQLARCYRKLGESTRSIAVAKKIESLGSLNTAQLDLLGTIYFKLGETEAAARCHRQAYELTPNNPHVIFNAASAYQTMGDLKKAAEFYEKVISVNPSDFDAHAALSQLSTQTPVSNHVDRLKNSLADINDNWNGQHKLCYALAKELEDLGEYTQSFEFLQRGSNIRRQRTAYSVSDDVALIDNIISATSKDFINTEKPGSDSEEPIFIVGMPRSGTTLVEQIVSSHSDVFAAGELHNFGIAAKRIANDINAKNFISQEQLVALANVDYKQLGELYIQSTRPRTGHTSRFIDKLPMNVQLCGHIHKALPKAKIIVLDRHPLDVCYSNFKLSFKSGYDYSYKLEDIGQYYLAYRRLVEHWQAVLPATSFYTISYESLVANQEQESKKLIEFCGLDWQAQCLQFYNNKEGVATASASQVRSPIYKSSVQRWKSYREQLQPLINILESGGLQVSD